jgi:hypothetical protein
MFDNLPGQDHRSGRRPMSSTTHGAGDETFADSSRAPFADCAYLHSAFGPGCPYCDGAAGHAVPVDPAGSSDHERPGHNLHLGAVA